MGDPNGLGSDWRDNHRIETYKSMITVSLEAYKYLALLNGGAAAGMLANAKVLISLIGPANFRVSLELFAWGLVSTVVALVLSWVTQNRLHNENLRIGGDRINYLQSHRFFVHLTLAATLSSIVLFAWGAIRAARHIQ